MKRWIAIAIIVVVIVGARWWYLRSRQNGGQEEALPTATVERGDLRVTVAATGVLEPLTTVEVKSRTGGEIEKLYVEAGDYVKAGDVIAQLDPTELQGNVEQAQATVDAAVARVKQTRYSSQVQQEQTRTQIQETQASLEMTRARLRQAQSQLEETRENTKQSVIQTQARLESARASLAEAKVQEQIQPELTRADISQAKAHISEVQATLDNAEAELQRQERLLEKGFVSQQDVDNARRSYRTAQAQLEQAKTSLQTAQTQQVQIQVRQRQRESAEAALAEAEAALATAKTSEKTQVQVRTDEVEASRLAVKQAEAALTRTKAGTLTDSAKIQDIVAATADHRKAQSSLDDVQYNFEHTTVVAPRDGVVLQKHVEEGTVIPAGTAALSQGTAIVTIADITEMYVMTDVDEVDISRVKIGQPVDISVETLTNVKIIGRVDKLYPQGQEKENVIYFPVRIKVLDLHSELRPGMTADVTILTAERKDVLLVPDSAIDRSAGEPSVLLLSAPGGESHSRKVMVGVTNYEQTEIISGLQEGDTLVLPSGAPEAQQGGASEGGGRQGLRPPMMRPRPR